VPKRRTFKTQAWTKREKDNISIYFAKYISVGKAPRKRAVEKFLEGKEHLFPNRSWKNIKDCVRNMGTKNK
jgi:hypothetical protein